MMIKHKNTIHLKHFAFALFCLLNTSIYAQVVNQGTVYISANTEVSILNNTINSNSGTITNNGNLHVYKSLTNNGIINYTTNTGVTIFEGDEVQKISGTGTSLFFNLEINNNANNPAIVLEKEIQIYGEADLTDGVLDELGNGLAVFENASLDINTSNNSYIDGKVAKRGDEEFVFPIGDNNSGTFLYRMAAISAPSNSNTVFEAEYKRETSNTNYTHDSKEVTIVNINTNEFWVIEPTNTTEIVDVTLSWNTNTTPSILLADTSKLIIVRWNGSKWVNEKGTVDDINNTVTATPTGYGVFTLAIMTTTSVDKEEFPDTFSPNGDGINDTFVSPGLAEVYPNFSMEIYNRYGNKVYSYQNNGKTNPDWWDGKSQGRLNIKNTKTVPSGTYWYVVNYNDGKKKPNQGWLYLNK